MAAGEVGGLSAPVAQGIVIDLANDQPRCSNTTFNRCLKVLANLGRDHTLAVRPILGARRWYVPAIYRSSCIYKQVAAAEALVLDSHAARTGPFERSPASVAVPAVPQSPGLNGVD